VFADEIVDMVAVRHGLVAAVVAVRVGGLVTVAAMIRRAAVRAPGVDLQHVLVDVVAVRVM
jgi:hypothetical protein